MIRSADNLQIVRTCNTMMGSANILQTVRIRNASPVRNYQT